MNKNFSRLNTLYLVMVLLSAQNAFAANFNIAPSGTLPTTVTPGQSVSANFTVTNLTSTTRNGYVLQGLPTTVVQNATFPNCTNPINLGPKASCQLQLNITGAVSSNFAICKGNSCTTSAVPLNVTASTAPSVARFAYVTQSTGTPIVVCTVNQSSGLLEACQPTGGDISLAQRPQGITINAANNTAYLTMGDGTSNAVQCPIIASTGLFGTCTDSNIMSNPTYSPYYGFSALNANNSGIYLVNNGPSSFGGVLYCSISDNTIQTTCTNTSVDSLYYEAVGITLNAANTVAYIDQGLGPVVTCAVSGSTFSDCGSKTGDGVITFRALGVALNPVGTIIYITDYNNGDVYGCDTTSSTSSTTFNSCFVAGNTPSRGWGITINAANTMAYVTNQVDTVYACPILPNGTFGTCTANTSFTSPLDIALLY